MEATQQQNSRQGGESSSGSQPLVELKAHEMHNIRAHMVKNTLTKECDAMIDYLGRSRIKTAITKVCTAYSSHQNEFWRTAVYNEETKGIQGMVQGQGVCVTAEILNDLLELGDGVDDPIFLNVCRVKGCLLRCGYTGEISHDTVFKTKFSIPYRYLVHVISHCLGPRRTGHDQLNQTFSHLFVALVLNVRFNISRVIFNSLKENALKKEGKFLIYPRFLQVVIESQVSDLVKEEADRIKLRHMNDQTVRQMSRYTGGCPPKRRLICHLGDAGYQAPKKSYQWRNENSTSQVENIEVVSDDDDEPEVQSQEMGDPTQGEGIPAGIDEEISVDYFLTEAEEEALKRKKDKEVAVEPSRKKRKTYRFRPSSTTINLTAEPARAAAAATQMTQTQHATGSSSQIPSVEISESVRKIQDYMLDMMKDESKRKAQLEEMKKKAEEKDLRIELLLEKDAEQDQLIESLMKKNEEKDQLIEKLLKKDAERDERMRRMEEILLDHAKEVKRLKEHVEEQDQEVLRLKQVAEGEPGGYSGDEQG